MNVGEAITAAMQEDRRRDLEVERMAFIKEAAGRLRIHYNAGQLETLRLARADCCPTCGR